MRRPEFLCLARPRPRHIFRPRNLRRRQAGDLDRRRIVERVARRIAVAAQGARRHCQNRASENRLFSRIVVRPEEIATVADELSRFFVECRRGGCCAVSVYQARTHDEWGVGIDAIPALDVWAFDLPGFQGLNLDPGSVPNMGYTAAGYADGGSYTFHFPDGNASLARLLVRDLIPGSLPGDDAEDAVAA